MTAVHNPLSSSGNRPGPQMYIACVQVNVKQGGSQTLPSGTQAGSLYSPSGDFANFNVYAGDQWKDPFPDVLSFASSFSSGSSSSSSDVSSSSASSSEAPAQTSASSADDTNNAPSTTLTSTASAQTPSSSSNSTGACRERRSIKKRMESHKMMKRQPFPHSH